MENKLSLNEQLPPTWLRFLVIALLALGLFFRFVNLEQKAYWFDETFTSLQLSGYTADANQRLTTGRVMGLDELQKYQYPSSSKSVVDTVNGLATTEPQLTPLYFVLTRFWVQLFGHSVAATRSFSAVMSLLVLPCVYWLCMELFRSPLTGWVAIALMAVSPFHLLYAQEARPYSLWTVVILLSCAALLRAMRLKTPGSWALYAVAVLLGLYTFLFSLLVSIAHGVYVVITERFRPTKTVISFLVATIAGSITFLPWIYIVATSASKVEGKDSWRAQAISLPAFMIKWIRSIGLFFADFNINPESPKIYLIPFMLFLFGVLVLIGYSIYFLCRNTPEQTWLFVVSLIAVPALILILPDLIAGGQRSTVTRYLIPCFLGMQLAVAYLFATQITSSSGKIWQQRLWQVVMLTVITVGVLSGVCISQSPVWWTKADDNIHHKIAHFINQSRQPLLVSDTLFVRVLSLSHHLDKKVKFQLVAEPTIPKIPDNFSDVFLYKPSKTLQDGLGKTYKIKPIYPSELFLLGEK